MKNRDIVNHDGAGKGDANRSPLNKAWRKNYKAINWGRLPAGLFRRGHKLVKKY